MSLKYHHRHTQKCVHPKEFLNLIEFTFIINHHGIVIVKCRNCRSIHRMHSLRQMLFFLYNQVVLFIKVHNLID